MFSKIKPLYLLITLSLILAACQSNVPPEAVVETLVVTEFVEATPVEVVHVVTPTPEPGGPRTLVICVSQDPETLYTYGSDSVITAHIHNAIGEGQRNAFDTNSFAYQPIIL